MTRHPEEFLAAYVDGDLDAADRRAVESHVRSCDQCRHEVELAREARRALATLPEVEPTQGTAFRVLREARRPPATGRAWRIATAAGVAASLVAGVIVLAQRADLTGREGAQSAASGEDAGGEAPEPRPAEAGEAEDAAMTARPARFAPVFVASNMRYAAEDMPGVLDRLARRANRVLESDGESAGSLASDAARADRRARAAAECSSAAIRAATEIEDPGVPFVFEKASFYNVHTGAYVPGYVAAFLSAPSPEEQPTSLFMTVVDRETCDRLLYYTPPVSL